MALPHILQFLGLTMHRMMSLKKPFPRKVTQKSYVCMKVSVLRKKPCFGQLSHGLSCKITCVLQQNDHISQIYSLNVNVNSEESFHVCMFSYPDPYFLKLPHQKISVKPMTLFLLSFKRTSRATKSARCKSTEKRERNH